MDNSFQLTDHLSENHLFGDFQSSYRCYHSCETALVRIHNDITLMLDSKLNVFLLLFDLSAAFDTVNHRILLSKLHDVYGLDQGWANYGPQAGSGPLKRFIRPTCAC